MALAVASTASNTGASGSGSITITKPSGLASGDLLIAVLAISGGTSQTWNTPSGWANDSHQTVLNGDVAILSKVADSSDAAASDFTFTASSTGTRAGALLRVTGAATGTTYVDGFDGETNPSASSATISFTASISPARTENLVILGFVANDTNNGVQTISGYTCNDGTISFTELFDYGEDTGTIDPVMGAAYGIQSGNTALTTYGATISNTKGRHSGVMVVVKSIKDASGTNALHAVDPTFPAQNGVAGTTGTNALHAVSPDFESQSGVGTVPTIWTNISKS